MKFERLRLRNFKCYADSEVSLREGVTVIHGINGSGKSSLLEACFFALYGSDAIDGTLADAISNDAEEMVVELWFSHDGGPYHVEREVKIRGDTAKTTTCVLETPDGTVEQVTDVEAHIEGLLRMDASAFVNCAYVRQGEVNKLINASPGERQDMIDELLQLGALEEYRERASEARLGVKHVLDDKRGALAQIEEQIEDKENNDLHARLNSLEDELDELNVDIAEKERGHEQARETLQSAESVIEEYERKREEIADLEGEIETLTSDIAEAERERETLGERIRGSRERAETLRAELEDTLAETDIESPDRDAVCERLEELAEAAEGVRDGIEERRLEAQKHASEAEQKRERAAELRADAADAREAAAELDSEVESDRGELDERRERLDALADEAEELQKTLADAPAERGELTSHHESIVEELTAAKETVAELRADLTNAREAVEEAEALLEAGRCPECGQPVEESPHVEGIEEDRARVEEVQSELEAAEARVERLEARRERTEQFVEMAAELDRLEERREDVASLVDGMAETVEAKADRANERRTDAEAAERKAEAAIEAAETADAEAEAARATIGELNAEKAQIDERRERIARLAELLDDAAEHERDVERLRERRKSVAEQNDLRRDRLADKRERRDELDGAFDEAALEQAEADKERAEEYLDEVETYLEGQRERRDELQNAIGGVKNELKELEALRERRAELGDTVARLESLYEEARGLQEMYANLRAELRQRNVDRLEAMLNETFDLVYRNDSYARIELDGEYELTVYQKDGTPLDPDQLSGGERALFNLSLRCAIYRLLSEGIEGQAPTPPLILDEPTVFLDSGHVSKLVELIESMTDHGVAQIVVVSHDEELVGAADDLIAVRKNPTTNRSSAERSVRTEALP